MRDRAIREGAGDEAVAARLMSSFALFDESLRIAGPPITRYLFARGIANLRERQFDLVAGITDDILCG